MPITSANAASVAGEPFTTTSASDSSLLLGLDRYLATLNRPTILSASHADFLALHLGAPSGPPEASEPSQAHQAVREWMQAELNDVGAGLGRTSPSDWLYRRALETVVRPDLLTKRMWW